MSAQCVSLALVALTIVVTSPILCLVHKEALDNLVSQKCVDKVTRCIPSFLQRGEDQCNDVKNARFCLNSGDECDAEANQKLDYVSCVIDRAEDEMAGASEDCKRHFRTCFSLGESLRNAKGLSNEQVKGRLCGYVRERENCFTTKRRGFSCTQAEYSGLESALCASAGRAIALSALIFMCLAISFQFIFKH
ncbi:uncharacterized protein LOC101854404 [Aplysia californica]|uniref:Uncharacterized protein LOC101854404 n=1 Tax=Aplysia californica TaxID=6500 RepID=A0ABM0JKC8_APLCA|nr:uncharacterized protein LOC101854404 [Aplysia californica]